MRTFGKLLQVAGLVILPLSMLMQLMKMLSFGQMLTMLIAGVSAFYLGRILEGYAAR